MQWWENLSFCVCWYGLKQRWITLSFLHYKTFYAIFQAWIKSLVVFLHNWKSRMALLESLEIHQCELMFLTTEWRWVLINLGIFLDSDSLFWFFFFLPELFLPSSNYFKKLLRYSKWKKKFPPEWGKVWNIILPI